MTITARAIVLMGPHGQYHMQGYGGMVEDDEAVCWECTDDWDCDITEIRKAYVTVNLPDPPPVETLEGRLE